MNEDPLLMALKDSQQRKAKADRDIRVLLAYARELITPRPYRLADLAKATGMSVSGVRAAYTDEDINTAAWLLTLDSGTSHRDEEHIAIAVKALTKDGI